MTATSEASARTTLRRKPQRGAHDEATIFAILDAGLIAHVGMTIDGEPIVIPTAYWREGRRLYWHGSAAGRMGGRDGMRVCVTVSHLDGLVVGRSGIAHSLLYRSVMAFGRIETVHEQAAKRRAMAAFIDRLYPGRAATLRPILDAELQAITVVAMALDEMSAKVRDGGVNEARDADYDLPAWAGIIPLHTAIGAAVPDARLAVPSAPPDHLAAFAADARLEAALARRARS